MLEVEPDNYFFNKNGERCKRLQKPLGVHDLNCIPKMNLKKETVEENERKSKRLYKISSVYSNIYRTRNFSRRPEATNNEDQNTNPIQHSKQEQSAFAIEVKDNTDSSQDHTINRIFNLNQTNHQTKLSHGSASMANLSRNLTKLN
jgi:hypothetical protein